MIPARSKNLIWEDARLLYVRSIMVRAFPFHLPTLCAGVGSPRRTTPEEPPSACLPGPASAAHQQPASPSVCQSNSWAASPSRMLKTPFVGFSRTTFRRRPSRGLVNLPFQPPARSRRTRTTQRLWPILLSPVKAASLPMLVTNAQRELSLCFPLSLGLQPRLKHQHGPKLMVPTSATVLVFRPETGDEVGV